MPALTDRDTVLLADFANTTREPLFDNTLKQALAVNLGQSPYLKLLPEPRVRETLKMMGRSPDERITRSVGREVCQREGAKALLAGCIAELGGGYVITLEAVNCQSGESLATEQVQAAGQSDALRALGTAATALRGRLGESLASIQKLDIPIERATTASLEALQAYSLAEIERAKGNPCRAIPLYKRAIELDPNFALAHGRLATTYNNEGEVELGRQHRIRAFELRDRVSEHEKFYITAHYYNSITGEMDKARETYELWKHTYPRDFTPYNNLAVSTCSTASREGQREAQEAKRIEPESPLALANLGWSYSLPRPLRRSPGGVSRESSSATTRRRCGACCSGPRRRRGTRRSRRASSRPRAARPGKATLASSRGSGPSWPAGWPRPGSTFGRPARWRVSGVSPNAAPPTSHPGLGPRI